MTGDGVIVNESSVASRSEVWGWVEGRAQSVLFAVAWYNPALQYVTRAAKGPNEISVRLHTPGGRWLSYSSAEFVRNVGLGYVSFDLQAPQAGRWTVEVSTNRREHTPYTVGGFVRSPLRLDASAPVFMGLGEPIDVKAVVSDAKGPLTGVKARATMAVPPPYDDIFDKYADELRQVKLPDVFKVSPASSGWR